jgi:Mn2+/Fe2+ NRAMP family transporter
LFWLWLVLVSVFWLVLFVPVSKFTILEGTPVREYPSSTRSTGAVLLVLVSGLCLCFGLCLSQIKISSVTTAFGSDR